ncbi:Hpt domain-containing protein [Ruegeria sp. Ofav3-42]|uniref:Hpt domain-containing protein n=1 Tax=Ruegeria sp. Ofav3-42 TaxID=2917759 RepID=UPI001EF6266F|nr:Hpt domain-containing protein [Ruegeria sp. Ofav3-42]MCG7520432.1 Hpt domain-containing protein [Ruegeria sp. Ofav3-42]
MINWSRVQQLRDEVGASEFDEVVQIFLDEVHEALSRLQHDTAGTRYEQNLHFLKGSALSLGFEALAKLCQDGERQSAQGQSQAVDLLNIVSVFESSAAEFKSGLGNF